MVALWELMEKKYVCEVVDHVTGAFQIQWVDATGRRWREWVSEQSLPKISDHLNLSEKRA